MSNERRQVMIAERPVVRIKTGTPFSALSTRAVDVHDLARISNKLQRAGFNALVANQPFILDERQLSAAAGRMIFNASDIERFLRDHVAVRYVMQEGFETADVKEVNVNDWDVDFVATMRSQSVAREVSFKWNEIVVQNYTKYVPEDVLDAIIAAREQRLFDYLTIASVKITVVRENALATRVPVHHPDPLVLGRFSGSPVRYLVAQYGDDINLDELLGG